MDAQALVQLYSNGTNRLLFENAQYPSTCILVEYRMFPNPDGTAITFECNYKLTLNIPSISYDGIAVGAKTFSVSTENVDALTKQQIEQFITQNTGTIDLGGNYQASLGNVLSY